MWGKRRLVIQHLMLGHFQYTLLSSGSCKRAVFTGFFCAVKALLSRVLSLFSYQVIPRFCSVIRCRSCNFFALLFRLKKPLPVLPSPTLNSPSITCLLSLLFVTFGGCWKTDNDSILHSHSGKYAGPVRSTEKNKSYSVFWFFF